MTLFCVGFVALIGLSTIWADAQLSPPLILTPYIKNNQTQQARNASVVDPNVFLNVTSHSGYLTVNEKYNSNTFFWYFPVEGAPVNDTPWILWLQGGPGASSLSGLFNEMGPFRYDRNNWTLVLREHSWSKKFSMLFIDNPIGAGYSFTDSDQGFATNMETYTEHLYTALQQFLTIFPELRTAPLYVAGESYAGRYVPALCLKILEEKSNTASSNIKLEGIIMGNPVLNREDVVNLTAVYYHFGLIDAQGVQAVKSEQEAYLQATKGESNSDAYEARNNLEDKLIHLSQPMRYNFLADDYDSIHDFEDFLRSTKVKEALHVGDIDFSFSNQTAAKKLIPDFLSVMQPKVETLLEHYRILIYCGQLDLVAPCVPSAEARRRWHWSQRSQFLKAPRVPWKYNYAVAGYVKSGGNLTEVLVRGAGHLVPLDKPAQAQQLIYNFIWRRDLPSEFKPVPADTPDYVEPGTDNPHQTGLIVSAVINVILVIFIALGVIYYIRQRRKSNFMYSSVENVSDDLFLT